MNISLNKNQFNALTPYEHHFATAKAGYCRGLYNNDVDVMKNIYQDLGHHLSSKSCPSCVLEMVNTLGQYYEAYKSRYYNKQRRKDETTETE